MKKSKLIQLGIGFIIIGLAAIYSLKSDFKSIETKQIGSIATIIDNKYRVSQVSDGDTITVVRNGQKFSVRLIGVDTPEVVDPRKPVQCFGQQASAKTKELLPISTVVDLQKDVTQGEVDKYGRILAYVFLPDGRMLNKVLIEQGYGLEYTYANNPYKYQLAFKEAEQAARNQELGLWNKNTCDGDTKKPAA